MCPAESDKTLQSQCDFKREPGTNQLSDTGRTEDTHSLSAFRGIFLGMVLRPSPWQSTVVPLQVHRAGQAPALPMSKAESITSHIQGGCPARLPRDAPKRSPLKGMFTSNEACYLTLKVQHSCYTLQLPLQERTELFVVKKK